MFFQRVLYIVTQKMLTAFVDSEQLVYISVNLYLFLAICHELTGRGRRFNVSRSKARYYLRHAVGVDAREARPEKSMSRRTET